MKRIDSHFSAPLHTAHQTKRLERLLAAALPPHTLMHRAGQAVARLARAWAPHARCIWVACGPGNNGGDGLIAATALEPWARAAGVELVVTWVGEESRMAQDARHALVLARQSGVRFSDSRPSHCDLVIDAVLGLGARPHSCAEQTAPNRVMQLMAQVASMEGSRLCVDVPSGLHCDTGAYFSEGPFTDNACQNIATLTLLTLKPGLFTAHGRDAAGEIWFDDLGATAVAQPPTNAPLLQVHGSQTTWLGGKRTRRSLHCQSHHAEKRPHSSHKGSQGDVWVMGGQQASNHHAGMTGAVVLAARAALNAGAGRIFVIPLGEPLVGWDANQPELMFRSIETLKFQDTFSTGCWVCGCGGGEWVAAHVGTLANHANILVLDADALNAISKQPSLRDAVKSRASRSQLTVMTPHPLEAARLLGVTTSYVQNDRLACARAIAQSFNAICVLKGSGTVIADPTGTALINRSGNANLATPGTGDVLAGLLGAVLAKWALTGSETRVSASTLGLAATALDTVAQAVWLHGHAADCWPDGAPRLTADRLCRALGSAMTSVVAMD